MTAVTIANTPLPPLVGMDSRRLRETAKQFGEPAYRGAQIAEWVYRKGARSFDEMTNLPVRLRHALAERFRIGALTHGDTQKSSDGVTKLLLNTSRGEGIEAVALETDEWVSSCVSSQVGCPMRCTFCATGLGGYTTNLTAGEIVDQILHLQRVTGKRVDHVGVMGMGEPLLNLDAVLAALRLAHEELGISYRKMHVSTVGIVPKIRELADADLPINLAISLHSPTDSVRERLMPVNRKWPVHELMLAAREYAEKTRRKVTFEYLMIAGENDTLEQARRLAALVKGFPCLVNLIPFNYVDSGHGYRRPDARRVQAFRAELEKHGVNVSQRKERGHGIDAACGQLKGKHQGKPIPLGLALPAARSEAS